MTGSGGVDTQAPRPKIAAMERGKLYLFLSLHAQLTHCTVQARGLVGTHYRR